MGRGRKGPIDQSQRKPKVGRISRERAGAPMSYCNAPNNDKILFLPEDIVDNMKQINPEQLVNILLPDFEWQ